MGGKDDGKFPGPTCSPLLNIVYCLRLWNLYGSEEANLLAIWRAFSNIDLRRQTNMYIGRLI
jgi:hypothetical protein